MSENNLQPENKIRQRVETLEAENKIIAYALKEIINEIRSEWGEYIVKEGTKIQGIEIG